MAWSAKVIEIFLSSPSDVSRERALVRKTIDEWNQRRARSAGCIFLVLGWETVTAEIEDYAQGSINEQVGDDYDVMLGLMWARFGAPTGKEDSGTFEEFKRALDRKRGGDALRISFYFKQAAPADLDEIDPDQLAKVRDFKKFIRDEGGLTGEFTDDESIRRSVDLLLERIAREQDKYAIAPNDVPPARSVRLTVGAAPNAGSENASEADDQVGILDLFERMDVLGAQFEAEMLEWTESIGALGQSAISATAELEELAQFGNPPPAEVRKVIDRVTVDFNKSAEFAEARSPVLTGQLTEFTALIDAQMRLLPDFEIQPEIAAKRFTETVELSDSMRLAYDNAKELIDTVAQLPRMATDFNVARHRLVRSYEPFLKQLEASKKAIDEIIQAMRRALPDESALSEVPPRSTVARPRPQKKRRKPRRRR